MGQSGGETAFGRVWATHVLFLVHLVLFLLLVIAEQATWYPALLTTVGLGDLSSIVERPWVLFTHCLFHRHYLEFILASGVLLLAGAQVERKLGTPRFLAFYALTVVLAGLGHVALSSVHLLPGRLFTGSVAGSAGILTAYLFLFGRERRVGGSIPFPAFYVMAAAALLAVMTALDVDAQQASETTAEERRQQAYDGESLGLEERVLLLQSITTERRSVPDYLGHLLGLLCGGVALLACQGTSHGLERYKVYRDIRVLQAEVDARARVEDLLEKISQDGMDSLTRNERKFLRYASKFYGSSRLSKTAG